MVTLSSTNQRAQRRDRVKVDCVGKFHNYDAESVSPSSWQMGKCQRLPYGVNLEAYDGRGGTRTHDLTDVNRAL